MAIPKKDTLLAPYATNWHTRISTGFATFGLTSAQAAAFTAVYTPWNDAWTALLAARESGIRSEQLTTKRDTTKAAMLLVLRELYAYVQANTGVDLDLKHLLGVTVRSSHYAPRPAPGMVSNFTATIVGDGNVTIGWKGDNGGQGGTMYQVWRSVTGSAGAYEYCGGTGQRTFTDTTLPAGASSITYKVQAVRSTGVSAFSQFNVNFTSGGGTTVTEVKAPKLAA